MRERLRRAFFNFGWLLPVLLPLSQVGGRALFNTFAFGYVGWAALALWGERVRQQHHFLVLYGLLLIAFFLGVPGAENSALAGKQWLIFLLHSLVAVFTLRVLQQDAANLGRLQRALGIAGLVTLLVLYLILANLLYRENFDPRFQLKEDNLSFLLPFMLMWVWTSVQKRWRYIVMMAVGVAVLSYVLLSQGRAALLGLLIAFLVFGMLVLRWRAVWAGTAVVSVLVVGLLLVPRTVEKAPGPGNALDVFTSGRSVVWRQALENPPARPLIGIGMGNGRFEKDILRISEEETVKHLHNFVLDAWRETGLLGVTALLSTIAYVLGRLAWCWGQLLAAQRQQAGLFLAAALAIMASALLSFSYTSPQFSLYLFLCFAALLHLTAQSGSSLARANVE